MAIYYAVVFEPGYLLQDFKTGHLEIYETRIQAEKSEKAMLKTAEVIEVEITRITKKRKRQGTLI